MIAPKPLPCASAAPALAGRPGLRGQSRIAPIPAMLVPGSSETVRSTPFRGYPEIPDDLERGEVVSRGVSQIVSLVSLVAAVVVVKPQARDNHGVNVNQTYQGPRKNRC